jgi:hypothetical protein
MNFNINTRSIMQDRRNSSVIFDFSFIIPSRISWSVNYINQSTNFSVNHVINLATTKFNSSYISITSYLLISFSSCLEKKSFASFFFLILFFFFVRIYPISHDKVIIFMPRRHQLYMPRRHQICHKQQLCHEHIKHATKTSI